MEKLGHQELILESLELLKQLHFSLDQEIINAWFLQNVREGEGTVYYTGPQSFVVELYF